MKEKITVATPVEFVDLVSGDKVKITGKKLKADQGVVIFVNDKFVLIEFDKFTGGHDGANFWNFPNFPEDKKISGRKNCWKFSRAGDERFEVERLRIEYREMVITKPVTDNPPEGKPDPEKLPAKDGELRLLIDHSGREIPAHLGVTSAVRDESRKFFHDQPTIGYAEIRELFVGCFPKGTIFLSAAEFEDRGEKAKEKILRDAPVLNIFNRTHLALLFPQHIIKDMGDSLQDFYLKAAKKAYLAAFPGRKFINHLDGKLRGLVSSVPGMGHENVIAAMAAGPVMGWYFPDSSRGFSVQAQREAMKALQLHGFTLAGAIEPALGMVGYAKCLARDYYTPGINCSAVSFGSMAPSFSLYALVDFLVFSDYDHLVLPHDFFSGGLVLLG